jgi:putative Mn2+ efflux pump MntP
LSTPEPDHRAEKSENVTASFAASVMLAAPLGTDSAALCAGIGARERLGLRRRLTIASTLTAFEAGMPVVGVLLAGVVSDALGETARIIGGILLAALGLYLVRSAGDDDHRTPVGIGALIVAGFAVSIDEIAVGVSLGLSGINLPVLVCTVAVIVFTATMAGLTLGELLARHSTTAGKVAGWLLVLLGALIAFGVL